LRDGPLSGGAVAESLDGLAIDPSRGILLAGTARDTTSGTDDFLAARYTVSGDLDPTFNNGAVEFIGFQRAGSNSSAAQSNADFARAIGVQSDGRVLIAGYTAVPVPGQPGSVGPAEVALARLDADGAPDFSFGQRGRVITDLSTPGRALQGSAQSVIVQPDGNIVVTGEAFDTATGQAFSAFAVARYVGATGPAAGTIPAGSYREDFASAADPNQPGLDSSGVFRHVIWYNAQAQGFASPSGPGGIGWVLGAFPGSDGTALELTGAADAITFPNLRADVHVGLVSVVVTAESEAYVTFVGDNGAYTVLAGGANETVAAGESQALETDADGNPTLELGPIRGIVLDSSAAVFDTVKILVIPGQGPLDDSVTAPPGTTTTFDLLDYATGGAPGAGLQPPLQLVSVTQPSLPGGATAIITTDPTLPSDFVQYTNTLTPAPGQHPTDTFDYTVRDSNGRMDSGTVYVTIDAPPVITVYLSPFVDPSNTWTLRHGTPGPFTGDIRLSDAEGDPISLTLLDPGALYGHVTLSEITPDHYSYEYDPPTISTYDPGTGLSGAVSDLVGDDQFTLEASDGITVADDTVKFSGTAGNNAPPTAGDLQFVVPENVGVTHYPTEEAGQLYDPSLARPGLVHFAAPGVLCNATDPFGDPLMALEDPELEPHHGLLELFRDGSFNYIPDPGFIGIDSFGFRASDGFQQSSTLDPLTHRARPAIVTIDVVASGQDGTPAAPVVRDEYDDISAALAPGEKDSPNPWGFIGDIPGVAPDDSFHVLVVRPLTIGDTLDDAPRYTSLGVEDSRLSTAGGESVLSKIRVYGLSLVQGLTMTDDIHTFNLTSIPTEPLSDATSLEVSFAFALSTEMTLNGSMTDVLSNIATFHVVIKLTSSLVDVNSPFGSVTVESPPDTTLSGVKLVSDLPAGLPAGVSIPWLIDFTVGFNLTSSYYYGAPIEVTILLPPGYPHIATYYKYGYTPPGGASATEMWYPFMYDPAHGHPTGAEIRNDVTGQQFIILHLIRGELGDVRQFPDIFSIEDPGGPGSFTDPARNFVASLDEDLLDRGPSDAEMARWVKALDRGEARRKVARAIWDSAEHRRSQVDAWSMQFLGHAADPRQEARWIELLRRGRGEIAVEQAILTSPDYRRAHPAMASFVAGLNLDVLGLAGDPIDPSHGRRERASFGAVARQFLTSAAAAGILAQQDATTFLGRPATAQERRAEGHDLPRGSTAPARIAERILASRAFYDFVNSALQMSTKSSRPDRSPHHPARHPRGR
jgi:uncharacterized delta-60 repeat protein